MSAPATRVGRRRAQKQAKPGPLPLAVAVLAVAGVLLWLLVRDGDAVRPGFAGGPVAMVAAFFACRRIGAMVVVARPVRSFWRFFAQSALCVGIGAAVSFALPNNRPGLSPYVAAPMLLGVAMALLAFLQLPRERRSALR